MNGFQLHNQQHTSASSINLWANAPDVWVTEKLFGLRGQTSPSATRGIVIEKALVNILAGGMSHENATQEAIKEFDTRTALQSGDKTDGEREIIASCITQGLGALREYGEPQFEGIGKQNRIELLCKGDGWEIPVIGYLDLVYPKHGLIIDIKTTLKAPSDMSSEHNRQAAIYRKASGNSAVKFLYITPKKSVWHECSDVDGTLKEIKQILTRQEYFLRQGDKDQLAKLVHYNPESFYWSGNEKNRSEVYGS